MRWRGRQAAVGALALFVALACRRTPQPGAARTRPVSDGPPPDIVLVSIDTLRADAPGFAGNAKVLTPTLDRLASQGLVFRQAHAHNVVTLPSHANILTGLYPFQHGVRDNTGFRLRRDIPTLATWLKARGYATGAFVGAFPLDRRFGLARDFDVYDDRYPKARAKLDFEMAERPAVEVVAAAKKWFDSDVGRPRFLFVHVYDCHAPYRPPSPFAERYTTEPYLGEVAAVDAALSPLLSPFLGGAARPALIILTADHGEALGDHGEATHGLFAYEATLHVPLVVWWPGRVAPGICAVPARHIDIAPTILGASGAPTPKNLPGADLLGPGGLPAGVVTYFEAYSTAYNRGWAPLRGALGGGFKFIDLPRPELYDLSGDPNEQHNLFAPDNETAKALRRTLAPDSSFGASERGKASPEEARRLRSLGYLAGGTAARPGNTPADDPKTLIGLDREIHRSIDLYQRGDRRGAIAVARRIVRERPDMEIGYVNLGFVLRQQGPPNEALAVYGEAIRRGIAGEELTVSYGLALCEAGRPAEAVRLLEPLAGSADPDTLNALGVAYADSGRSVDANRVFERILAEDRESVEALANLGIVRLRAEDATGARDFFRRALDIDSQFPRAWNGLGVAMARLRDERSAMDCWQKAADLDPKLYDALYNLGLTAGKNGLTEISRRALSQFVATAPPALYSADIRKARSLLAALQAARAR